MGCRGCIVSLLEMLATILLGIFAGIFLIVVLNVSTLTSLILLSFCEGTLRMSYYKDDFDESLRPCIQKTIVDARIAFYLLLLLVVLAVADVFLIGNPYLDYSFILIYLGSAAFCVKGIASSASIANERLRARATALFSVSAVLSVVSVVASAGLRGL